MSLLQPMGDRPAYLKAGIYGFNGSGKTYTATKIAIGLHKFINSKKPISFLDTETGSDFVTDRIKDAGIEPIGIKTRSFSDLLEGSREASTASDILIVDSMTHFWEELVSAYEKKFNRARLRIWDFKPIKQEWNVFTDFFLMSQLHIILCGRAGWVYEEREDEEGVSETKRTQTKMKVEADMGYEPSLLIEMERTNAGTGKVGQKFINRAWVLKDRFDLINGRSFDFPKFEDFLPHIQKLNIGGKHVAINSTGDTEKIIADKTGDRSRAAWFKRRDVALEEIEDAIVELIPGQTSAAKQAKIKLLKEVFATSSWTAIKDMSPDVLETGLKMIREKTPVTAGADNDAT